MTAELIKSTLPNAKEAINKTSTFLFLISYNTYQRNVNIIILVPFVGA